MKSIVLFPVLVLASCGTLSAQTAAFHVNAAAQPNGDGSSGRPWRTPIEAVRGIRAARATGNIQSNATVVVEFAPGDYPVDGGILLGQEDSGCDGQPIVWRSSGATPARFVGARRIPTNLFHPADDPDIVARLPAEARGKIYVADLSTLLSNPLPPMATTFNATPTAPILFVAHRPGTLARWPNDAFATFSRAVDKGGHPLTLPSGKVIRAPGAFVFSNPRVRRWDFSSGVWLNGYWTHDWDNQSVRAARYGTENGTNDVIRLAEDVPWGVMGGTWGRKERRFYAFNLLEELDAPGEWWLDRPRNLLYVYPPTGNAPTETDEMMIAFAPEPLLKAHNIHHLRLENLSFEYNYGDGLSLSSTHITLVNCRVANVGGTGITLNGDCNTLNKLEICNTGNAGIRVSGGDRRTLRHSKTLIEDCHIHDWAHFKRTYAPGLGISGCGMTIRRNLLHDAPHSAVLFEGNDLLLESNEVYRVLLETGDAGAYYTGRDWTTQGNVLRYNYTHDLGTEVDSADTMGFYFDDCDCGDEVYGNVFHNIARGIMIGGGRDHPVRNNIFSHCTIGLSIDGRGMTWKHWNSLEYGGPSWMLEDKAKAFDYTRGIWADRYPRLAQIMQNHPREPLDNPIENNIFIDCRRELIAIDDAVGRCLARMAPITNNLVINTYGTENQTTAKPDPRLISAFRIVNGTPQKPFDAGFVDTDRGDFTLRPEAWLRTAMPSLVPQVPNGRRSRTEDAEAKAPASSR